jgi:hypothetical protein
MKPVADASPAERLAGGLEYPSSSGNSAGKQPYWSASQLRVTVLDGDQTRTQLVSRPIVLFGSHPECDVVLSESAVSKRYYCILATDRGLYGTSLTGQSSQRRRRFRRVTAGRKLRMGRYRLRVELVPESEDGESDLSSGFESDAADWRLEWVENGVRHSAQLRAQRPLLVGRGSPSQIVVNDPAMSCVHFLVYAQLGQLWVVDLCSSNGTWVRRSRAPVQRLAEGQSFRAGATRFRWLRLRPRVGQSADDVQPAEVEAARSSASCDELNGLKEEVAGLHHELQTLRTEHERVCQDAGDLSQRRAVLERDEMAWKAWYETEEARLSRWAEQLQAQQEQATRERDLWNCQRAAETDQWEESTRQQSAQLDALRAALEKQQDDCQTERRLQAEQTTAQQQQMKAERDDIAQKKAAIQQAERQLQEDRRQHLEAIACIRGELAKTKTRLAAMQREREQWLVQRIRTQRALTIREQSSAAKQHQLEQQETQLACWEAQLRKQQQEITDQRRRDLELASSSSGSHPPDTPSESAPKHLGIQGRPASSEDCLSASNFFELLDRALREKEETR